MADRYVRLGLGEAVQRLIQVEVAAALGIRVMPEAMVEAELLRKTLDQYDLEVAWDCDGDGAPDTVEIYEQAATTSCCRLVEPDKVMSRRSRRDSSRSRG